MKYTVAENGYDVFLATNVTGSTAVAVHVSTFALPCSLCGSCPVAGCQGAADFAVLVRPAELSLVRSTTSLRFESTEAGRTNMFQVVPKDTYGNVRDRQQFELSDGIEITLSGPEYQHSGTPELPGHTFSLGDGSGGCEQAELAAGCVEWHSTGLPGFDVSFVTTVAGQVRSPHVTGEP